MSARSWLVRDLLIRVVGDAPAAPATWLSVGRRSAVVGGLFVAGVVTDSLPMMVFACFGALQVGILEAALPLRALIKFMAMIVVTTTLVSFVAMVIGGTWWMVFFVAAIAYVFGSTAGLSPRVATVGITALAMAVIFSGMPQSPELALRNAALVLAGAAAQGIFAVVLWKPERSAFVRRALAIKISTDLRLIRYPWIPTDALVRTHAATDSLHEVLADAQLSEQEDLRVRRAFSDVIDLTRALVAWQMIRRPSDQARMDISQSVDRLSRKASAGSKRMAVAIDESTDDPLQDESTTLVRNSLVALRDGVTDMVEGRSARDGSFHRLAAAALPGPRKTLADGLRALAPERRLSRHGLRMATGLFIAEVITLVLPINHSFWLPLTVVFTLKPDWAFTVVRGFTRTLGNLAAVVILPILLGAIVDIPIALAFLLVVLSGALYRWFFGNYMIASFGLAGSVLLLDYTLDPDSSLFLTRIAAAVMGALLSLVVAYVIPNWSSDEGPARVDEVEATVRELEAEVRRAQAGTGDSSGDDLDDAIIKTRHAISSLDAVASAALLEPRPTGDPVALSMVLASGTRMLMDLLALGYVLLAAGSSADKDALGSGAMQAQAIRCQEAGADFDAAVGRYRISVEAAS